MRLLDLVAQSPVARVACGPLPSSTRQFSESVRACPLRLVLADDLARCSTVLAFAEGDRLGSCSDLIRVPAQRLWIEWADAPRLTALQEIAGIPITPNPARRAGALIRAAADGRSGEIRTFWSSPQEQAHLAPLIAEFDLDEDIRNDSRVLSVFEGGYVGVGLSDEPSIDQILRHIRFRFDPPSLAYYQSEMPSEPECVAIVRAALGTSAFDLPMLFALCLLMAARDGAQRRPVDLLRLNRARQLQGKPPLLEHVEVSSRIAWGHAAGLRGEDRHQRSRRLHHVRGHIARRGSTVYWRSPHMRGSARAGVIKSRTVTLSFN